MTSPSLHKTIYIGPFVHCVSPTKLEICTTGAIGVDERGVISFIDRNASGSDDPSEAKSYRLSRGGEGVNGSNGHDDGWDEAQIVRIHDLGFFFPGFIDTHTHASQYPNAGIFGHSTLLDWLETYTFPTESTFSDLSIADRVYTRVVARLLSHGTTTAAYYATIHVEATNHLASICQSRGQRALVGRVCMDRMSPAYYRDANLEAALEDSRACIAYINRVDPTNELLTAIVTPRFAPSCSRAALSGLAKLASETGCPCQTHIAENKDEIELVKRLFPESESYASVYDESGLLNERMILAHAVHLSADERALIAARKAKISHCPASNTSLTSGTARVRTLLDDGIDVGLGTDVSGGYNASILEQVRQAILVSRHVAMTDGDRAKLSTAEALYLATKGGAKVVGMEDKIGGFAVGMHWDAQMISLKQVGEDGDLDTDESPVDVFGKESWDNRVAKWVYGGDDRNTLAVWVKGRLVHNRKEYQP